MRKFVESKPKNTLQLFITNRCNKRCKGCFYEKFFSEDDMSMSLYTDTILKYKEKLNIEKVILIGGEPTLHPQLEEMVSYNRLHGLATTIYSNGYDMDKLERCAFPDVNIRVGVLGLDRGEKTLKELKTPNFDIGMVYMLRKGNEDQLMASAKYVEKNFDCHFFMISSIHEINKTGSFFKNAEGTIPHSEFKEIVDGFLKEYEGKLDIHVCRRTTIEGCQSVKNCRYLNVYPDGSCTICPLDISLKVKNDPSEFGRLCNKHHECILQKVVYKGVT